MKPQETRSNCVCWTEQANTSFEQNSDMATLVKKVSLLTKERAGLKKQLESMERTLRTIERSIVSGKGDVLDENKVLLPAPFF